MYEQLSANGLNILPIMSACSSKCFFCSNKLNPFPVYTDPPRPLDEIKKAVLMIGQNPNSMIDLSYARKMTEGEAIQHPNFFEILDIIRKKHPQNKIFFYTNGVHFTEENIKELSKYSPINVSLSIHSINSDYWCEISGKNIDDYTRVMSSLSLLSEYKIKITPTVVPMPELVGWDDIDQTIEKLSNYSNRIQIYTPGFTDNSNEKTKKFMNIDLEELSTVLNILSKKYSVDLSFFGDPNKPINFYPEGMLNMTMDMRYMNVLWMFSEFAYTQANSILNAYARTTGNNHYTCSVKNYTYGGNIKCAGLLTVDDFKTSLKEVLPKLPKIDCIMLPGVAFDSFGEDLKSTPYSEIIDEFDIQTKLG